MIVLCAGCGPVPVDDRDGDGYGAAWDCDDADPAVSPGAAEVCDGAVDEDCDGRVDEGAAVGARALILDYDGDGHGAASHPEGAPWEILACGGQPGYSPVADDCDDADPSRSPSAAEVCGAGGADPADEDCDGRLDEGFDGDGDGWTTCDPSLRGEGPPGGDCDDADPSVHPGAEEICDGPPSPVDDDCDGAADESPDSDGDGFPACPVGATPGDCDDADGDRHPGAAEACDGADDDCDGRADEGWDADGDGFTVCGDADLPADCADGDATVFPGAEEVCDGRDQDCDGWADEAFTDADGDGAAACIDCDDADPARSPLSFDDCDAFDDDCDGRVDEGGDCPCPVQRYDEHTYLFCPDTTDQPTARRSCQSYGYDLVAITTPEENAWVALTASQYVIVDWWVGLSDAAEEGVWRWPDGAVATFTNWAPGEPNNLGEEDCVGLYPDGHWNDKACDTPWYRYICEAPGGGG